MEAGDEKGVKGLIKPLVTHKTINWINKVNRKQLHVSDGIRD